MNAKDVRAAMAAIPVGGLNTVWQNNQRDIRTHAAHEPIEEFLKWSTIQKTMFVGQAPYIVKQVASLLEQGVDPHLLIDDGFGGASTFDIQEGVKTSGTYIGYCACVAIFGLSRLADTKQIIEVGGGYGVGPVVAQRAGFKGTYTLLDLPEMLLLQQYYLEHHNISVNYTDKVPRQHYDLLIAMHSIDEMPLGVRDKMLEQIEVDHYLFAYMPHFEGVDNEAYFRDYAQQRGGEWQFTVNPHYSAIRYAVGDCA